MRAVHDVGRTDAVGAHHIDTDGAAFGDGARGSGQGKHAAHRRRRTAARGDTGDTDAEGTQGGVGGTVRDGDHDTAVDPGIADRRRTGEGTVLGIEIRPGGEVLYRIAERIAVSIARGRREQVAAAFIHGCSRRSADDGWPVCRRSRVGRTGRGRRRRRSATTRSENECDCQNQYRFAERLHVCCPINLE